MRNFLLAICLIASGAEAQWLNYCGSGRQCSVTALSSIGSVTSSGGGNYSLAVPISGSIAWCDSAGNCNWLQQTYSAGTGATFVSGGGGVALTATNAGGVAVQGNGAIAATTGFNASVPFASFPSVTGITGRLLFDSTNNRWRWAAAGGWIQVAYYQPEWHSVFIPAGIVTGNAIYQWGTATYVAEPAPSVNTVAIDTVTVLTTGIGAGNITYTIYNATDAANTTATVTIACTTAIGTVTAGSADSSLSPLASNRRFQVRITASACATNPVVNMAVANLYY
jgi:hypothetical protein